jgi:alkaline phosphatase
MVEGGRIDHAGHWNDAAGVLAEMREFDEALGVALGHQKTHPSTLVIVTADHETGGLSVTSSADHPLTSEDLVALGETAASMAALSGGGEEPEAAVFGIGRSRFYPPGVRKIAHDSLKRSAEHNISFGTYNHTTTPVPIVAVGPGSERFRGIHRNTVVGRSLLEWMKMKP